MSPKEFFDTVVQMREYQRAVKRTKGIDRRMISFANDFEKRIDMEIARVKLIEKENMSPTLKL